MSTITAQFIAPEKYLERYAPHFDAPTYHAILDDEYQYAQGVEVYFGSVVIAHWMVASAYFDLTYSDPEEGAAARQEALDEIVGAALKRVFGSKLSDTFGESDLGKMFGGR